MEQNRHKNRRRIQRTLCSLDANFSFDQKTFKGRIQNMSNYGAVVLSNENIDISEGKRIHLTIACDGKEDVYKAQVVWADAGSFGAKFIRDTAQADDLNYLTLRPDSEGG